MIANYHGTQNAKNSQKKTLHFITMKAHTGDVTSVWQKKELLYELITKLMMIIQISPIFRTLYYNSKIVLKCLKKKPGTINKKINMIDKIITDNQNMKTQINTLESKIEFLERRLINNEIVIDGVPENKL